MKWAAALTAAARWATAGAPRPIAIVINGDALSLDPPPRFEYNLLFVPVRRTIEALGLDFQRSGDRITTQIGSKTVVLTIGSRDARVDAATVSLEGPTIEVKDVLYVPLRFFTDVLGAQAHFDRRANTVNIVAQLVGRTTQRLRSTSATATSASERWSPSTCSPIRRRSRSATTAASRRSTSRPNAAIDVEDVNVDVTSPGELGDVRPGDFARVEMSKQGRVQRIVDEYGSRNGHIVAIAGNQFVLDDGQVIAMGRTTEVSLNGAAAAIRRSAPKRSGEHTLQRRDQRGAGSAREPACGQRGPAAAGCQRAGGAGSSAARGRLAARRPAGHAPARRPPSTSAPT